MDLPLVKRPSLQSMCRAGLSEEQIAAAIEERAAARAAKDYAASDAVGCCGCCYWCRCSVMRMLSAGRQLACPA